MMRPSRARQTSAQLLMKSRPVARARSGLRGSVRLSAPPALLNHFVLPRLAAWRQRHPQMVLHLLSEMRNAQLERGESDLALRLTEPDQPGLVARPLARLGYGLYRARLALPGMQGGVIAFDSSLADSPLSHWATQQLAGFPVVLCTNDLHTMASAVRAGWGMALLPHFLGREMSDLVLVEQAPQGPERVLHLAMHPDLRRAPRVRALADGLTQLFEQHGALLA